MIFDGDLVNEIKTFDTISQRSVSEKKDILIVPATELFKIQQSDILNLSSNKKENLDDYELFQYSQNLDVEKCLLDLTNNVAIHIVDKNIALFYEKYMPVKNNVLYIDEPNNFTFRNGVYEYKSDDISYVDVQTTGTVTEHNGGNKTKKYKLKF